MFEVFIVLQVTSSTLGMLLISLKSIILLWSVNFNMYVPSQEERNMVCLVYPTASHRSWSTAGSGFRSTGAAAAAMEWVGSVGKSVRSMEYAAAAARSWRLGWAALPGYSRPLLMFCDFLYHNDKLLGAKSTFQVSSINILNQ